MNKEATTKLNTEYPLTTVTKGPNNSAIYRVTEPVINAKKKQIFLYLIRDHDNFVLTDHQITQDEIDNFGKVRIEIDAMSEFEISDSWQRRNQLLKQAIAIIGHADD